MDSFCFISFYRLSFYQSSFLLLGINESIYYLDLL